ncbi:acyltransferase family protein [Micromonospora auratinigra]|uniref:Peptidoglycan/LPS O-acetylase OafA/YrhL, contains acyltransferase and SGNH-hydrolase domains n=1 Tax=Micromonospora auratinigra TaxID=261654 RepID=A0A1A9A9A2_9ACTN|nr:acyltransferase family protein [Micromonospora auratinigra]SBT52705.1 Peptidoglycan/LPS O-acetylase OafA/YrhL, contains acyltransferase and SGNH-hydrolase domains [Micromonospora auratinigra]
MTAGNGSYLAAPTGDGRRPASVAAAGPAGERVGPGPDGGPGGRFRPDIQGLRAFAVVVVILEHVLHAPAGGFLGVDVFFVISGFLITGLLLAEHERAGRISLTAFYRRRIRRILPMAMLVLVCTYLASSLLFLGERVRTTAWDTLWAALFAANWRFAATGTDYWATDGPVSPLRHYWSLAVEEQFYLVWPVLLLVVLGLAATWGRAGHRSRWAVGALLGLVVLASVALALREASDQPTTAYFSTFARAWELGVGALLAVAAPLLARIPAAARPAYQWLGLAGLVVSVLVIDARTPFPAPGAFLPVISTALVIAGGVGGSRRLFPLTSPAARYLGDISYSLYLWHFPLLVLLDAALPGTGLAGAVLVLALTVLLSSLSYHLVEDPIRRAARGRRVRTGWFAALLAAAATVATATVVAVGSPAPPRRPATQAVGDENELTGQIRAALAATDWPLLVPSVGRLGELGFTRGDARGCRPAVPDGNDCTLRGPRPAKVAVVVGDSIAAAWLPSVRAVLEPAGWVVRDLTYAGCPFLASDTVSPIDRITRACPGHRRTVRAFLRSVRPDLVVVSNAYRQRFTATGGNPSLAEWERAARAARAEWLADAGKVVDLQPPPVGADPKDCITRLSSPGDCVSTTSAEHQTYGQAEQRVWAGRGSWRVPTTDWFCLSGRCPIFVGGVIVRRDANHITAEYAEKLAPLLRDALTPVLAAPPD